VRDDDGLSTHLRIGTGNIEDEFVTESCESIGSTEWQSKESSGNSSGEGIAEMGVKD